MEVTTPCITVSSFIHAKKQLWSKNTISPHFHKVIPNKSYVSQIISPSRMTGIKGQKKEWHMHIKVHIDNTIYIDSQRYMYSLYFLQLEYVRMEWVVLCYMLTSVTTDFSNQWPKSLCRNTSLLLCFQLRQDLILKLCTVRYRIASKSGGCCRTKLIVSSVHQCSLQLFYAAFKCCICRAKMLGNSSPNSRGSAPNPMSC